MVEGLLVCNCRCECGSIQNFAFYMSINQAYNISLDLLIDRSKQNTRRVNGIQAHTFSWPGLKIAIKVYMDSIHQHQALTIDQPLKTGTRLQYFTVISKVWGGSEERK